MKTKLSAIVYLYKISKIYAYMPMYLGKLNICFVVHKSGNYKLMQFLVYKFLIYFKIIEKKNDT